LLGWDFGTLDKLIFYASDFVRENRALEVLRDARITVVARPNRDADEAASVNVVERN
jgi:hypothetical protein